MRVAHPDMGGNIEWAAQVNNAKACLKDPEEKKKYDAALIRHFLVDGSMRRATFNFRLDEATRKRRDKLMNQYEEEKNAGQQPEDFNATENPD